MKNENLVALEKLGGYCYFGGMVTVCIGMLISLIDFLNADYRHMQIGLYILIMGYAIYKIGVQLMQIVASEKIH